MSTVTVSTEKVKQARKEIARVLNRYNTTLTEIMGADYIGSNEDERVWEEIEPTYRKAQAKVFREMYPSLAVPNAKNKTSPK